MKKYFLISFLISLILVISSQVVYSQTKNNSPQYQTFEEWCINRENLTPETLHTVEVLLEVAETKECSTAQSVLEEKGWLELTNRQIIDVSPLANLINLKRFGLYSDQIKDMSPLANLTNLELLDMGNNPIRDISPLANLVNLYQLFLYENQIKDVSPLTHMMNLRVLCLNDNRIPNRNCPFDTLLRQF